MITTEEIREKLRLRLIEHDGNIAPHDLVDIIEEAEEIGISREQIARLVPEVDRSINWEHIRAEKLRKAEEEAAQIAAEAERRKQLAEATEYLDALISYCMADGIVEAAELKTIFEKAIELGQSTSAVASKIKTLLDKGQFKPYPNADLNASGLPAVLMSTSWYMEKLYQTISKPAPAPPAPEPTPSAAPHPPPQRPRIHSFSVYPVQIKSGEIATLSWEVSGVSSLTISHLGTTTVLKGQQAIRPEASAHYVLTTAGLQKDVMVNVLPAQRKYLFWKIVGVLILLFIAVRLLVAFVDSRTEQSTGDAALPPASAAPPHLSAQRIKSAPGLKSYDKTNIVDKLNDFLAAQEVDEPSDKAAADICSYYSYPIGRFYGKRQASCQLVFDDVVKYRQKFKPERYEIDEDKTSISSRAGGGYSAELFGTYRYSVRKPQSRETSKSRYVHSHYELDEAYLITSVWEVK